MSHVYFHCSNKKEVLVDRCGAVVDDLAEARDHAACVVRSLTTARSLENWRGWILHVNDDLGDELFVVLLAFVLGNPIEACDPANDKRRFAIGRWYEEKLQQGKVTRARRNRLLRRVR